VKLPDISSQCDSGDMGERWFCSYEVGWRCCPLRCFHEALLEEEVDLVEGLFTLQFGLHLSQEKLPICRKVEKRYRFFHYSW
jgi:hypothetical protein